jgi:4,5-dihydroxyphthalate decarboxylase
MGQTELRLTCALGTSDLNRALIDGTVSPNGVALTCVGLSSPERHWRTFRRAEFPVAEVSFGAYLSIAERRPDDFLAIPAFPHRRFRHSYIFVGHGSPLESPEQLNGARIGLRTWTNTAGVWTRGILEEFHGVDLSSVTWIMQDSDTAGAENLPAEFTIEKLPPGESVVEWTRRGDIDALIYPEIPQILGAPEGLRRLLPDAFGAERDFYRDTGLFPIMHTVAIRRSLIDEEPWLPFELLRAFRASKDLALTSVQDPRSTCVAWVREAYEAQVELMGPDPFGYSITESKAAIEALIRYALRQGIVTRPPVVEELFAPATVDEPPQYVRR